MSFQCPQCVSKKSLRIIEGIELPPDIRSAEIPTQIVQCSNCKGQRLAVHEESSRGLLGSESVDHFGYNADLKFIRSVRSLITHCPNPKDANCNCRSHQKLNQYDKYGRWLWRGIQPGQPTDPIRL